MRRTKKLLVLVGVLSVFLLVSTTALAAPACPSNVLRGQSVNGCATAASCNTTGCANAAGCNTASRANAASCNTTSCANSAGCNAARCNTAGCNTAAGCTSNASRNASGLNALKQAGTPSNVSALLQSRACASNGANAVSGNYAQFASLLTSLCKIK